MYRIIVKKDGIELNGLELINALDNERRLSGYNEQYLIDIDEKLSSMDIDEEILGEDYLNNIMDLNGSNYKESLDGIKQEKGSPYQRFSDKAKHILSNDKAINFQYYFSYRTENYLCPVCGRNADDLDKDHFYPKQQYNLYQDRLYNLSFCCRKCNTSGKNIKFHPYFMYPNWEVREISFSQSSNTPYIYKLHMVDNNVQIKVEIEDRKLEVEVSGKKEIIKLGQNSQTVKGVYVGFLLSIMEVEAQMTELQSAVYGGYQRYLDDMLKCYHGNKSFWKYVILERYVNCKEISDVFPLTASEVS